MHMRSWIDTRLRIEPRRAMVTVATTIASLALTTGLIAWLQDAVGVPNASSAYLLAVVVVAVLDGTAAAGATAVGAFLLYDFLFVEPAYTLTVADPDEWVNLILLLVVGLVVGQLAAGQRNRAEAAEIREREARLLFRVSRALATRSQTLVALTSIVDTLRQNTAMTRVRVSLGSDIAAERVTADTDPNAPFHRLSTYSVLKRMPGEAPATWVRVHDPASRARRGGVAATTAALDAATPVPGRAPAADEVSAQVVDPGAAQSPGPVAHGRPPTGSQLAAAAQALRQSSPASDSGASWDAYRVTIEAGGRPLGALWALRPRFEGAPTGEETRMLAAAADQIGQAVEQDRLREEATSAELARRSDALKTALLDSVSHDLRTPLAAIRAAAGSLMDPQLTWTPDERRQSARTIDLEAERLNRLVTNLLDMSRIEAGGLRADAEPYPLDDLVATTLGRLGWHAQERRVSVAIPADLPLVLVDPTFMDQILTNVIENALKYTPPDAPIRVSGAERGDHSAVRLTIEDGGPGVPEEALPQLFDKFYRVPRRGEGPRRGTGIGLAVVRGLVETMGGHVTVRRGAMGGLALDIDLPEAAPHPAAAAEAVGAAAH